MSKYESQRKWQEKTGLISKTYKLNASLVKEFKEVCEKINVSQASKLSELMQNFIDETNTD